jgi:hypothetical protein
MPFIRCIQSYQVPASNRRRSSVEGTKPEESVLELPTTISGKAVSSTFQLTEVLNESLGGFFRSFDGQEGLISLL